MDQGGGRWSILAPPPPGGVAVAPGKAPTFSIVMAAYQVAPYIADAVGSALEQTYPPLEVIICDDGSTDDLDAALAPFRDRITLLRQDNRGVAAAKDAGTRAASGDFVAFLDGDDTYEARRLEALAELAVARPDLDILATDAHVRVGEDVVRSVYGGSWTFEAVHQRRAIVERCFILGHAAVRRERLLGVGGFDTSLRIAEDWELWIRLIFDGARAGFIPEQLATWRVREGSLSTYRLDMMAATITVLERAAARDDLAADERRAVALALRCWRRDLALAEARAGLLEGRPGTRQALFRIGLSRGVGLRTRIKTIASGIAPGIAARIVARQQEQYWVGAGEQRVRRSTDAE